MAHPIVLTDAERQELAQFIQRGKANARTLIRAITQAFAVSAATVSNVRQRYRTGGVERVLHDTVQANRRSALTGLQAAPLIAIACTPTPEGHDHGTVRLLADKAGERGYVERTRFTAC